MSMQRFFNDTDPRAILLSQAKLLRDQAAKMPPGDERDRLIAAARKSEAQANLERWANSPGLQPPEG
jgi:hypothetical protein